jgi:hypothetical protein
MSLSQNLGSTLEVRRNRKQDKEMFLRCFQLQVTLAPSLCVVVASVALTLQRRGLCTAQQRCLPHVTEVCALHGSVALSFSS